MSGPGWAKIFAATLLQQLGRGVTCACARWGIDQKVGGNDQGFAGGLGAGLSGARADGMKWRGVLPRTLSRTTTSEITTWCAKGRPRNSVEFGRPRALDWTQVF